ncbi:hypothetical protein J7355_15475 [Endozoicomonas sp. G2_2]|uniref:hypothetical protein n=1 Tax=Endozoicomonas sp. G2_2 TaxID=2821092 RepID=UPI001ADC27C0|nr:hypothetical protein [Endozoicomonas sp. G2_2]MBO9471489.1 hypothetical protein [Endozoicomonas sp. G2_2]
MADRFYGEITFPRHALAHAQLRDHITAEFSIDSSDLDTFDDIDCGEFGINLSDDDLVILYDAQARYGEMQTTEAVLIALGTPFDARAEQKYEYDSAIRWWRPGMDQVESLPCNADGQVTTTVEQIVAALNEVAETDDADDVQRRVREVLPNTSFLDNPLSQYAEQAA